MLVSMKTRNCIGAYIKTIWILTTGNNTFILLTTDK